MDALNKPKPPLARKCGWLRLKERQTKIKAKIRLYDGLSLYFSPSSPINNRYRELNKVYTNGTLVDPELLTDEQAGHCISICEEDSKPSNNKFGICVLDCSTSQFNLSSFEDDVCRTKLETLLRQIRPKELLFKKVGKVKR